MLIRVKKNWKDFVEGPAHAPSMTRREILAAGLATGALGIFLPKSIVGSFISRAHAAPANCPAPVRNKGAIGHLFVEGGATMGAYILSDQQATSMTAEMANNYGQTGQADLIRLGPNFNVGRTSPFGAVLLAGPQGYPGGAAAWQANVLRKCSAGMHLGPFNQDDGAGDNRGMLGGSMKTSLIGKDLRIGVDRTVATWVNGLPFSAVRRNPTPANFANIFSLNPPAAGLINQTAWSNATDAANQIAATMVNNTGKKGAEQLSLAAGCGFYGNVAVADPTYGASLFTPANIPELTAKATIANLTGSEQAHLAAFYQSAQGVAGGVITQLNGFDYHDQDPIQNVAAREMEAARVFVMFLAACDAAQARGALSFVSNGQAIADGVQNGTVTINGQQVTVGGPVASGDAGGSYNAGQVLFYDPAGAPPAARATGTLDVTNGNVRSDAAVTADAEAIAGLFLSSHAWINNGTIPANILAQIRKSNLAANPTAITLI